MILLILASLAILTALGTILLAHPLWCATSLVVHLLAIAVLFILQGAPFVGIMQILLYAGAIVVLILFVIMILGLKTPPYRWAPFPFRAAVATIVGLALMMLVALVVVNLSPGPRELFTPPNAFWDDSPALLTADYGSVAAVGTALFRDYLIPFEAVSVLLLVAIVGSVVLGKKKI